MRRMNKAIAGFVVALLLLALFPVTAGAIPTIIEISPTTNLDDAWGENIAGTRNLSVDENTDIIFTADITLDAPLRIEIDATSPVDVRIIGKKADGMPVQITAASGMQIFQANTPSGSNSNYTVHLENLILTGGDGDGGGSGSAFSGWEPNITFSATGCTFRDNKGYSGGAIYAYTIGVLKNCVFQGNEATGTQGYGGAIYAETIDTISGCTFTGNAATGDHAAGGAIFGRIAVGTISDCIFTGNKAPGNGSDGGAIYAGNSSPGEIKNCLFEGNSAGGNGGAVRGYGNGLTVADSEFYGNPSGAGYGAVHLEGNPSTIKLTLTGTNYFHNNASNTTKNTTASPPISDPDKIGIDSNRIKNGSAEPVNGIHPKRISAASGDPVLPMSLPADFTARRATAMLSMPMEGAPVVRPIGYYYTVNVIRLAENGYAEVSYRGQTGYIPLKDLGRSEGLTW